MNTQVLEPARLPFAFEDALNAGDVDAVLALFSPDATMRTPAGEVLTGPEELRAEIVRTVAAGARLANTARFCLTGDDTALIVVDWALEATAPDGTRATPTGTTANVARRSADGAWQFTVLNPLGTA
ncbi:SgcJ/EcaC family oxidoreductase [Streptomyces sp. UNOC14_S4]|uniref:YybH family protein n=1 Tax=Streptomyces sp. UNOC14_S4 TaxID=2872340 RepID=UPI001E320D20|nr:nuclear transport factor 2 family protein [Streptomyces sp. UNOC14_S4]MCC3770614.1 nuclear transport factor 2 family protein [Streptomyces sp. UNOC14_S4]